MRLEEYLQLSEGKTLEFKRDLSSSNNITRSLVAFANTAGGILLVGVEDKTRRVCGVRDALIEEEQLFLAVRPLKKKDHETLRLLVS